VDSAYHKDTAESMKVAAAAHADTNPWPVVQATYAGMQWELSAEWRSLSVPLLFITGASDTITPFSAARMAFDTVVAARMGLSLAQLSEKQASAAAASAASRPRNKSFAEVTTGPQRRPSMAVVDEEPPSPPSASPKFRPGRAGSTPNLNSPARKGSSLRRKASGVDGNRPVGVVTARVEGILVKGYSALQGGAQLAVVGTAAHQVQQEQPKVVNALLDSWMRDYALPRTRTGSLLNRPRDSGTGDVAGLVTGSRKAGGLSARQLMEGAGMGGVHEERGRSGSVVASLPSHFHDSVDEEDGDAEGAFDEALDGLLPDSPAAPVTKTPPAQPAASRASRIAAAAVKGGSGGAMGSSAPPSREASSGGSSAAAARAAVKSYAGRDDSDSDSESEVRVAAPAAAAAPPSAEKSPPASGAAAKPVAQQQKQPPVHPPRESVKSYGGAGADSDSDSDSADEQGEPDAAASSKPTAAPPAPQSMASSRPKLPSGARKAPRGSRIAAMLAQAKSKSS